jgi:hypothetical protein
VISLIPVYCRQTLSPEAPAVSDRWRSKRTCRWIRLQALARLKLSPPYEQRFLDQRYAAPGAAEIVPGSTRTPTPIVELREMVFR